jgi:hypothetical protein
MLRIAHCLDFRFTDGCKVVRLTNPPHFTPQKHYFSPSVLISVKDCVKTPGLVRLEGLDKLKQLIHLIVSRIRNLPDCSIVSQPLRYRAPINDDDDDDNNNNNNNKHFFLEAKVEQIGH